MASEDPPDEQTPGGAHETLRRLERRLDDASAAAERLIAQAAAAAASRGARAENSTAGASEDGRGEDGAAGAHPGDSLPPAGWQMRGEERSGTDSDDLELLAQVIRSLRGLVPPDLERRLAEALRELLLALRALIDWYLERHEQRREPPSELRDIPIL